MNLTLALVPATWTLIADILLLLWFMKAGIRAGMEYHFLGATLLTLMIYPEWSLSL